ncbi:hypothetical protein [Terasakiella pusilla]|uniref:hypothetical protein n=1 Tax=Terasakiella pusilla TaxID=64973 RepID=UPI003AA8A22E
MVKFKKAILVATFVVATFVCAVPSQAQQTTEVSQDVVDQMRSAQNDPDALVSVMRQQIALNPDATVVLMAMAATLSPDAAPQIARAAVEGAPELAAEITYAAKVVVLQAVEEQQGTLNQKDIAVGEIVEQVAGVAPKDTLADVAVAARFENGSIVPVINIVAEAAGVSFGAMSQQIDEAGSRSLVVTSNGGQGYAKALIALRGITGDSVVTPPPSNNTLDPIGGGSILGNQFNTNDGLPERITEEKSSNS